jgi:lysophospholipase L1-like esterase
MLARKLVKSTARARAVRKWHRAAVALGEVAALALVTATLLGDVAGSAVVRRSVPIYYLDIGASVSVGVQPTPQAPKGQPTNEGYANKLVSMAAAKGVKLRLTQIGCPGESTLTLITGNNPCYRSVDNQFSDAEAYLRAHHTRDVLVTIDLGFNNVVQCMRYSKIDSTCVNQQLNQLQLQMAPILKGLTRAAGPNVTLIGIGHYNPFLASSVTGTKNVKFASASVGVIARLNQVIENAYRASAIPMANVAGAFATNNTTPIQHKTLGLIPTNVARICSWTWMCAPSPYGPNLHPNDLGYRVIARAIMTVLPVSI